MSPGHLVRSGWLDQAALSALARRGWLDLPALNVLARPGWVHLADLSALARSGWLDLAALSVLARPGCFDLPALITPALIDPSSTISPSIEPALCMLHRFASIDSACLESSFHYCHIVYYFS